MDARAEPDVFEMRTLLLRLMRGINGQAFRNLGNKVLTGPFAGMVVAEYTPKWDDGNSGTKLLGCYEHELHGAIERAIERAPELIVNVGCAEGYYAVGLARRCPQVTIFALDIYKEALSMCGDYAEQNGVKIHLLEGTTEPEMLRFSAISGDRLYMMDCEGAELELLDLERVPELYSADIIVECHDFLRPGASKILAERFGRTHEIELIRPTLPDFGQFPFLRDSPAIMSLLVAVEKRPMPCYWLTCWANRGDRDG